MKCIGGLKKLISKVTGIDPDSDVDEDAAKVDMTKKAPDDKEKEKTEKDLKNPQDEHESEIEMKDKKNDKKNEYMVL